MRELSLSSNKKIILLLYSSIKKKKNTCTFQTYNYVYSHFKICYLKHGTKQIFLYYKYFKHVFSQHFSNHNFHIILNNNTWKLLPNKPIICQNTRNVVTKLTLGMVANLCVIISRIMSGFMPTICSYQYNYFYSINNMATLIL